MDARIKARWAKALRSGKFKQGGFRLKQGERYCCLGVLGAITGVDVDRISHRCFLPKRKACGLSDYEQKILSQMNDGTRGFERHSFRQIASYIEKHL